MTETRWPASIAVAISIGIQAKMPERLTVGGRWLIPGIELLLLATLLAANPRRLTEESRDMRLASLGLLGVLVVANTWTLVSLLQHLLRTGDDLPGRTLIYAGAGEWGTAIVAFGVWYWEIDRGGPTRRFRDGAPPPDFMFPQMGDAPTGGTPWAPRFVDYLYLSLTNSTAFSPTDVLPLTHRAKLLMGWQAIASLATIALVGARAVNILG